MFLKKNWVITSALVLGIQGCAIDDTLSTQLGGTGIGTVVGGAVGYMVGGKEGASIGAVLGGGLGFALGNDIAKRKQNYVNKEDALDGEIAYYSKYNKSVGEANRQLEADIASLKNQSKKLIAKYKRGQISKSQVLAQKQIVSKKIANNQKYISELNTQYQEGVDYLKSDLQGGNAQKLAQLKKEQGRLQKAIKKAKELQKQMARVEQGMSV